MNAMVLRRARPVDENPLESAQVETPTPHANEIRIAVSVCGVCHTELHTVEG